MDRQQLPQPAEPDIAEQVTEIRAAERPDGRGTRHAREARA